MKTIYKISSNEIGTILLRRRKVAKALRWWLRENDINFTYSFFLVETDYKIKGSNNFHWGNSSVKNKAFS
jgi:hypothetical protein